MPKVTQKYKDESFDRMLRRFRNQCERGGIVKRVRELQHYEKPNQVKHQKAMELKRTKRNDKFKTQKAEMRRRQTNFR